MGLIVFAVGVAVVWTVLYVAFYRSGSTIHAATGRQQQPEPQEPYTATSETDSGFLRGDFPEQPDRTYRAVQAARRADRPSRMPLRRGNY